MHVCQPLSTPDSSRPAVFPSLQYSHNLTHAQGGHRLLLVRSWPKMWGRLAHNRWIRESLPQGFLDVGWYNDVFWALRKLEAPGRRRHCPNQIIESHASPRAPPRLHLCMPWVQVCMRVLIASIFISCLSQWVTGLCGERLALDAFVLYTVVYRYTCLILRLIEVVIYRQAK